MLDGQIPDAYRKEQIRMSIPSAGEVQEPIVPMAVRFAWCGGVLSFATIIIGLIAVINYARARSGNPANANVIGEVLLVAVPLGLWPLLWILFGCIGLRRLQRGDKGGRRLSLVRLWLALPLVCIHVLMVFLAGVFLWPHLDLIMLSLLIYISAEVLFAVSGFSIWRAQKLA